MALQLTNLPRLSCHLWWDSYIMFFVFSLGLHLILNQTQQILVFMT